VFRLSKLFPTAVVALITLSLVLALAPLPGAAVIDTGITSTSSFALSHGIHRKIFYDGSKWWLFVWDGSYLAYYYSTDLSLWTWSGTVWGYGPYFRAGGADVRISGSTVYVAQAYYSGTYYYIYFVKGTINGTTITWGSVITVLSSSTYIVGGSLGVGTDGRLWIVYSSSSIYARYSTNDGTTWTETIVGSTTSSTTTGGNIIVPMSGGKMMVIHKNSNNNLLFSIWDGSSWSTPTQIASGVANGWGYFSAASNGDVVYLAYTDSSGNINFMKYSGNLWTSPRTIATASTTSHPVVEYDYVNKIICVFWVSSGTIYVAYSTDDGATWTTRSAGNDSSITANDAVSGAVQVYNGQAVIAYLTGTASPYTVKLATYTTIQPTLGTGRPVILNTTTTIAPGDAIAPHLYVWFFDGVNDYVEVPHSPSYATTRHTVMLSFMPTSTQYLLLSKGWWGYYRLLMFKTPYHLYLGITRGDVTQFRFPGTMEPNVNAWTTIAYWLDEYDANVKGAFKDGTFYTPSYDINPNYPLCFECPNPLRIMGEPSGFYPGYVAQLLIYPRILSGYEVYNAYTYNIINASGLTLFLDPTFYNGTHYLDLSGYNNHGVGYGGVARIPDSRSWFYVVKGLYNDGYVHLRYFPIGSRVEVYDSGGNLVATYVVSGTPNVAGLVADFPVSLPAGTYTVKVYTYTDYTIYQNAGTTRTTNAARYPPSFTVRLAVNVSNVQVQAIRYQVATDPNFNNVVQDVTVSTALNYVDATLPNSYGTYYVRVSVRLAGGLWTDWSNTYTLKVDALQGSITASKYRFDVSGDPSASYSLTYVTDNTPAIAPNARYNVTITSLLPSTYKGTARPLSTHSYFASSIYLYTLPTTYSWGYVLRNIGDSDAPYWAKAVGAPSTNFALVYQSYIYLPQSGTYTFEVYSDDGVRLYVNGTLLIDGWSGKKWPASASTTLNAGWYNVTVKMWQGYCATAFLLGLTLPNGTAVRPLIPAKGIQMAPPPGGTQVFPTTPFALLTNYVVFTASGSVPVSLGVVGVVNVTLTAVDGYGFTVRVSDQVVFDAARIRGVAPVKQRFTVGEQASFNIDAVSAYDGTPLQVSVSFNDTLVKTQVGMYGFKVISVSDSVFGLTKFYGNTTVSAIFDKVVVDSYVITAVGNPVGNGTRVGYTLPLSITAVLKHAYDGTPLTGSNAVRVELAGVPASWDGSSWRTAVPAPNVIVLRDYPVVSYAESTLGVKSVDSPTHRVIYDAIMVVAMLDQIHGVVTFTGSFMYDLSPVPSGRAYVRDAGTVVNLTVSGGLATYTYNPFRNGTVEFVNMSSGLVFSNPVKPGVVVVRSASPDGLFAVTSTTTAVLRSYLRMEGLANVIAEAKGNVTLHHSGSLKPVAVFVDDNPALYTYVDGVVFLEGLSSVVEAWYSVITDAQTFPGAAPVGAVYEIGFADNAALPNATLRVGLLVNGSVVIPFLYYGGFTYYGPNITGLGYPLDVGLTWGCSNEVYEINYMLGFMLGGSTYYRVGRHVFLDIFMACSNYLYPYLAVLGNSTGIVDKYGAVVSEILRYWSAGAFRMTVAGKIPAGSMVRYLVLNSPTNIVYAYSGIQITPSSSTAPVTLVGFKGFTLSYSVAGVTISNVIVTKDEYPLEFPYGIALMVVADPSTRTVSIIQVAAIQPPIQVGVTATAPGLYIPSPPAPTAPSWSIDFGAPSFIVLYGSMVAVAIIATRITGSIPRGIMMSAVAFGLVMTGMGVFTRNITALATAMLAFIIASSMEIARRHAT
jgi:hypothetical protein